MRTKYHFILALLLIIPVSVFNISFFEIPARSAGYISYELSIPLTEVSITKNGDFDTISLPDHIFTTEPGKPHLPFKVLQFAIDNNAFVSKVEILSQSEQILPGVFLLPNSTPSLQYSENGSFTILQPADPRDEIKSTQVVELAHQGSLSGVNIATIHFYPFEYIPDQKQLVFHQTIKLRLSLSQKSKSDILPKRYPSSIILRDWLKKLVVNPDNVDNQFGVIEPTGGTDYLIITSKALADSNAFEGLINDKVLRGLTVIVQTVETIRDTYPGRDLPEQIRNYIIDEYTNNGVIWVLLGGDARIIPVRWTEPTGQQSKVVSDLYYGDLQGSWDGNNNNIFGEPDDGLDYYPEVFVGRAPIMNKANAEIFINKVLLYQATRHAKKALFLGAEDYFDSGGKAKDYIIDNYLPFDFEVTRYYERDLPCYRDLTIEAINSGYNLINHIDHSGGNNLRTGCDAITLLDISMLSNNTSPSIMWSGGCSVADFSEPITNIATQWITNPNGGGPAFIGNSGGSHHPQTDQMLDPEFYKSLFIEGYVHIGQTFFDSRLTFIGMLPTDPAMMHDYLGFNLLGDPEMIVNIE